MYPYAAMCDDTQDLNETESKTFSDTKFVWYQIQYILYQIFWYRIWCFLFQIVVSDS